MSLVISRYNNDIYTLKINRPNEYNALNTEVLIELDKKLDKINNNCRIIVLTGVGNKAFIAGADIKAMKKMSPASAKEFSKLGQDITKRIENSNIPFIAAVNGYALGGGCEFALSCHIRIASDNAIFGQPEVGLGLIAGFGGLTIFLQDDTFLKWKVTIVNLFFAVGLLVSQYVFKKNLIKQLMGEALELPDNIWNKLNLSWVGFFTFCGLLNVYIAFNFSQEVWVNFKVFGLMGMTFVFAIGSIMTLYKYFPQEDEDQTSSPENKE